MSDIVERLKNSPTDLDCIEAAKEIEQLRAYNVKLSNIVDCIRAAVGMDKGRGLPIDTKIEDLELSVRTKRLLMDSLNCRTVSDILIFSPAELLRVKEFGRKSLQELLAFLSSNNLQLRDGPVDRYISL